MYFFLGLVLLGCNSVQDKLEGLGKKLDATDKSFLMALAQDTNILFVYAFDEVYKSDMVSTEQLDRIKNFINEYNIEELTISNGKVMIDPKYFQLKQNEYRVLILSRDDANKIKVDERCQEVIKIDSNVFVGIYPNSI